MVTKCYLIGSSKNIRRLDATYGRLIEGIHVLYEDGSLTRLPTTENVLLKCT